MPAQVAHLYAQHADTINRLAGREGGVSRAELMEALNASRGVINSLIKEAGLEVTRTEGRSQYFGQPESAQKAEPAPKQAEASEPTGSRTEAIDRELADLREAIRDAAAKAGEALATWATQQAAVDAFKSRVEDLLKERLKTS